MASGTVVVDATDATFADEVLRRSEEVPVVVDFWAKWCAPCRALGPLLERLAHEDGGAWVLARVDVDANPSVAGAYGVRSIPLVIGFRGGRPVAEFVGALPESEVRAWLGTLGPTPGEIAAAEGAEAEARGDLATAADAYRRALAHEPANGAARAGLARAELELRAASVDEAAIRARAERDTADVEAAAALADVEFASGEVDAACARLVEAVRRTAGDERERARARLVGLLDTLPPDDPRALRARRDLAAALF